MVAAALPGEVVQRMGAIQRLLVAAGTGRYGEVQAAVAKELGVSVRSVQRPEATGSTVRALHRRPLQSGE